MTHHFGDRCGEITISSGGSQLSGKAGGGGGVGHPDPKIRRAVSRKCFFSPSGLILILKGVEGGARLPGLLPWIRHWLVCVNRSPISGMVFMPALKFSGIV